MSVAAFDWNATRVRAVAGSWGDYALPVPLDPPHLDLPLAISLAQPSIIGAAALRQCRHSPKEVCHAFLPYLTAHAHQGPQWQLGRQTLDVRAACDLVWRRLHNFAASAQGILLTVPGYLQPAQVETLRQIGERAKLPILGSMPTLLATAIAGHVEQCWREAVLVVDVDEYALTLGWVIEQAGNAQLIESRAFPHLGLRFWKDRLINTLADLFVWQHRRDPRDVPQAEQCLYDQLDTLTDASAHQRAIQLAVQGPSWIKHLLVHPEQTLQFCQPIVNKVVAEAEHLFLNAPSSEMPHGILLTQAAGRLPGLSGAMKTLIEPGMSNERQRAKRLTEFHEEDFGEDLLQHYETQPTGGVMILPAEAPARMVHTLSERFRDGELPHRHLETSAPLLDPPSADFGPPRLHYRGHDYLLRDKSFVVGSMFGCQLWFDKNEHPEVSGKHCEIVYDRRAFTLLTRGSEPTLVNEHAVTGSTILHAGDHIRLGPRGPMLRFLGKTLPRNVLSTR
jgi:hypothetical protein